MPDFRATSEKYLNHWPHCLCGGLPTNPTEGEPISGLCKLKSIPLHPAERPGMMILQVSAEFIGVLNGGIAACRPLSSGVPMECRPCFLAKSPTRFGDKLSYRIEPLAEQRPRLEFQILRDQLHYRLTVDFAHVELRDDRCRVKRKRIAQGPVAQQPAESRDEINGGHGSSPVLPVPLPVRERWESPRRVRG